MNRLSLLSDSSVLLAAVLLASCQLAPAPTATAKLWAGQYLFSVIGGLERLVQRRRSRYCPAIM